MKEQTLKRVMNWSTMIGLIATVAFVIYGFYSGIFTSTEALGGLMSKLGIWAPVVFVIIQIIQVVIPIIPGAVGCAAGVILFGPLWGFIYNYVGISIGSCIAFLISKQYGLPVVKSVASEKTFNKYCGWLDKGNLFDKLFATAIFLPVAPDDFLCYLAGLTKMTFKKFTAIIVLCKPASIFLYSLGLTSIGQLLKMFIQ